MSIWITIVLDGVGIGEAPDAHEYGDEGSNTLGHICTLARPALPNLTAAGLGNIASLTGVPAVPHPQAVFGKMQEASAGKDSTTGHWELAGLPLDAPFPTYADGFPEDLVAKWVSLCKLPGALANCVASGTAVIEKYGAEHLKTGKPIVYTSADSVFQVAVHTDCVPIETLYHICEIARNEVCVGPHAVGRVIARPFTGEPGAFRRLSGQRKDFSYLPTHTTLQEALQKQGVRTIAIGKIGDLFGNVGFDEIRKTKSNAEGINRTIEAIQDMQKTGERAFIWTNLVDFDQEYGHRNDVSGFSAALQAFDAALPEIRAVLPEEARLCITADHGNDPSTPSTDHSREYVPLLLFGSPVIRDIGTRGTFADHAQTVAAYFQCTFEAPGSAF
ncbi:MAG: phosphopentomutase [Bacteroidetes Order II. Incertae sedis bacterium]|nr:phosphopentomutase [Bacteroidetes Order II. bacterium]